MIRALRGMHDVLPPNSLLWQHTLKTIQSLVVTYGYQPIMTPLLENVKLFERLIGEQTDVLNKEMYVFEDRSNELISLRPEGTAGCIRAVLQNKSHQDLNKLWYFGPMFRYERPQKGRLRQFHQFGIEITGIQDVLIDIEILVMLDRLWRQFDLSNIKLELNNIGDQSARSQHVNALKHYFLPFKKDFSELDQMRLEQNPFRLLDSKSEYIQSLLKNAPKISEFIDISSKKHFDNLRAGLDQFQIKYTVNDHLVRGLDYYNQTVFEWKTNQLGSQSTVCGGGRFDHLSEQLDGSFLPAIGCSIGWERLLLLIEKENGHFYQNYNQQSICDVYALSIHDVHQNELLYQVERLRSQLPNLLIQTHLSSGSVRSKFKQADKSNAEYALILAPDEWEVQKFILKPLKKDAPQHALDFSDLIKTLQDYFSA